MKNKNLIYLYEIQLILKRFAGSFHSAQTSYIWRVGDKITDQKNCSHCSLLLDIQYSIFFSPFFSSKHFLPDFKLPGGCHVLIIEEINYAGGQKSYKQNLTKFYKFFKSSPTVVICIRSEVTRRDFSNLQIYCVVELGLPLVPVRSIHQIPQLVHQLILVDIFRKIFKF